MMSTKDIRAALHAPDSDPYVATLAITVATNINFDSPQYTYAFHSRNS